MVRSSPSVPPTPECVTPGVPRGPVQFRSLPSPRATQNGSVPPGAAPWPGTPQAPAAGGEIGLGLSLVSCPPGPVLAGDGQLRPPGQRAGDTARLRGFSPPPSGPQPRYRPREAVAGAAVPWGTGHARAATRLPGWQGGPPGCAPRSHLRGWASGLPRPSVGQEGLEGGVRSGEGPALLWGVAAPQGGWHCCRRETGRAVCQRRGASPWLTAPLAA